MAFHRLCDKKGTDVSANVFHFALPDDIWAVSGPAASYDRPIQKSQESNIATPLQCVTNDTA